MDVVTNLYNNSGLSGVVSFFSGKPATTTVSVNNVIKNAGLPTTTPNTAAVAQALQRNVQSMLGFYQVAAVDATTGASPASPRYIAFGFERVVSSSKMVLPPVKKTVKI